MKLTLHIGTEKTGSTSIQRALASDRENLAQRGILYPRLFGSENHMEIAVAAMAPNPTDELQMVELGRQACTHEQYRARLREHLRRERDSGDFTQIIISNEHCHSRLRMPDAIERLIGVLDVAPSDIEVIVYLRRQDRLAISLHSTRLKLGGSGDIFPPALIGNLPIYFRFERLLNIYSQVIGAERIKVRLYERDRLAEGDVVADFYSTAGLGLPPPKQGKANISLSRAQGLFLEQFNQHFPMVRDGKINAERGPIFTAIRATCPGVPFRPAQDRAMAFYAPFRRGNAEVRERFLSALDRSTLFDEDFSEYPALESETQLTQEELFDFINAIWRFRQAGR